MTYPHVHFSLRIITNHSFENSTLRLSFLFEKAWNAEPALAHKVIVEITLANIGTAAKRGKQEGLTLQTEPYEAPRLPPEHAKCFAHLDSWERGVTILNAMILDPFAVFALFVFMLVFVLIIQW